MTPTTTAQICEAVQGVLFGSEDTAVTDISTDSRSITPGAWFVPLAGERFDGHDYIDMALDKGAAGCFCARLPRKVRDDLHFGGEHQGRPAGFGLLVPGTVPYPRCPDHRQHGENHL